MIKSYRRPANPGINLAGMPRQMRLREEAKMEKTTVKVAPKRKTSKTGAKKKSVKK